MFWRNYEYLCRTVGKSPNAVAAACGVKSTGTVSAWKKSALPKKSTLNEIAGYFHVDADELVNKDLTIKNAESASYAESELDKYVSITLNDVLPDEVGMIHAFFAGLKASRKT